jgi:hypothetical protein
MSSIVEDLGSMINASDTPPTTRDTLKSVRGHLNLAMKIMEGLREEK